MDIKAKTGMRFGRLVIVERDLTNYPSKNSTWICQCDCGNVCIKRWNDLKNGNSNSCGCLKRELASSLCKRLRTKHGGADTQLYNVWKSMRGRCLRKSDKSYKNYGERGIGVCDEWQKSYQAFSDWSHANGYQHGLTIDRIDNDGNYEPANCRWITNRNQAKNRRTNNPIKINGITRLVTEWCDVMGVPRSTYFERVKNGQSPNQALRID